MNWASLSDFLSMRGAGLYVWGSYGVTAALMLIEPWLAIRQRRSALQDVAAHPSEKT